MRATQRAAIKSLVLDNIGYSHLCLGILCLPKAAPWHIVVLFQWYGVDTIVFAFFGIHHDHVKFL